MTTMAEGEGFGENYLSIWLKRHKLDSIEHVLIEKDITMEDLFDLAENTQELKLILYCALRQQRQTL